MNPAQPPQPAPMPQAVPPQQPSQAAPGSSVTIPCPQCHLPVPPEAYFCANCGQELRAKPLSTSAATQAWIYAFSIILPMIAYLAITHWPGIKYLKSSDERAKQIGIIATALLVISTVVTFWLAIVWIQNYVQQSVNDINTMGL